MDGRFPFIVKSIAGIANASDEGLLRDAVESSRDLRDFLDDPLILATKATISSSGDIKFTNKISHSITGGKDDMEVLFMKTKFDPLSPDNIWKSVDVHALKGSPLDSLYNALRGVWGPMLTQSTSMPLRVQQLLAELQESLTTTVRYDAKSNGASDDLQSISVSCVTDELRFWQNISDDRKSSHRNLAKEVIPFLELLSKFDNLDSINPDELIDFVDSSLDALNSIWNVENCEVVYPQVRMQFLFATIGSAISKFAQIVLSTVDLSNIAMKGEMRLTLNNQLRVFDKWINVPKKLSQTFWTSKEHPWKGTPFEDCYLRAYRNRLKQILDILTLADELTQILTTAEKKSFKVEALFALFSDINGCTYNPYTDPAWLDAMKNFYIAIEPIETAVAMHFKTNATTLLSSPQLLLNEFKKYKNLLGRPTIRRLLISERETLFSLILDMLRNFEASIDRIDSGVSDFESKGGLVSQRVSCIIILKQLESKIVNLLSTSLCLLSDLNGFDKFRASCENLVHRIHGEMSMRFEAWMSDMQSKIDEDDDAFRLKGSLMGWTSDGILTVNFSPSLVQLLREVRQLDDLGFEMPKPSSSKSRQKNVTDKAIEAGKYYRYGILLKKTANFFNSIKEQMVDVQEQLLLDSLKSFVQIVSKRDNDLSWSNPVECENYIRILQEAAVKLSSENRWLRKIHENLIAQSLSLFHIDLLRQTDTWKMKWRVVKEKMTTVRSKYTEMNTRQWVLHWDHQIYKVLEAGYQMGLESLNENLPVIKAELFFANKVLDFKPPLEQIRQAYYHEVRKFIGIPNSFEGFGNSNVYRRMISINSAQLVQVFGKAESLFSKLTGLLGIHMRWVKLGQIDMDTYVEANVKTPAEFVENFKSIRIKRKEFEKLVDQERVGCCLISFTTFKGQLEDLTQRLNDTLLITLRRNLVQEFKDVDQFLENSNEKLSTRPHSVEEIGNAKRQWKEIDNKKDIMKAMSKACIEKKKLLIQYISGSTIDISEILAKMTNLDGEGGRWDDFDIALEAFNDMIEEQKETLKVTLEEDVVTLNVDIDKFANRWRQLKPTESKTWEYSEIQKVFAALEDWQAQFNELFEKATTLIANCLAFAMPKPRFDSLDMLVDDFKLTVSTWDTLKTYYDELNSMAVQDWLTFSVNVYTLQDFATKWSDQLKGTKGDSISEHILTAVDNIKKSIPALKYCRGEPFKEDHWIELLQGKLNLGRNVNRENVNVGHFLSRLEILMEPSTLSYVKNLQARALGEVQIREALQELKAWERSAEVSILTQEESGRRIPLIKDWKDLFLEVGDKQSLLSSLKESPFFKAFLDQGHVLEQKMAVLDAVLQMLNLIQRKWVYLEPIFTRGALPSEEVRFRRVDEDLVDIMVLFSKEPKLFYFADDRMFPNITDKLKTMLDQLERCQKALTDFLEVKRSAMPRFYFIGDDDLLEILGQAKNPNIIQSHLKKLFQGINKVKFNSDSTRIVAMISSSNEVVDFQSPVIVTEKVEDWLDKLASEMKITLAVKLVECLQSKSLDWNFPSQIICLAQAITFTESAEHAIQEGKNAIQDLKKLQATNLKQLTSQDFSSNMLSQLKMKALVLDILHNLDVLSQLLTKNVTSLSEWKWRKQIRYYFERNNALVRMSDAEFQYTFEYQGNAPKLVHTPLTDKCYLTLTQGVHMGFGGNPYGPAGTGKTESVKALASCLGRQVLVFNCDEGIDFQSMGRIFIGLVKSGAWGCFDEFNRLKEDQLSAISQQIQIIQDAIKIRSSPIQLLGRNVDVNFNAGIFVTLNPAGKGYGGRSRLPDNLKALFRPICMGAPDNELIAEVNLVTEGFLNGKDLASKIVALFKLSRQLLSPQQHYDWGLRALKAVLNSGGRLIQNIKYGGTEITSAMEYEILIKAIRVNTLSKLTYDDTIKFLALIGDVFPGATSTDISGGELEEAIRTVMKEKPFFLGEDNAQIKKMIQLKESLDQRMGCVVVGPSGCGKSVLWRVLKAAMIKCGQSVVTHVMNPKSMTRERLLGHMDLDTREWYDGVLTDAARQVVREPAEVRCWIICDGDVDPEWIESLNSVLDDNHLLTLPNGERISFGPNVNFLFETHDLKYASPATVSRMGMIFLSDEDLDVKRLIERWLSMLPQEKQMTMSSWIDELFYKSLKFVTSYDYIVETTLVGALMNGLSQIKTASSRQEFIVGLIRGLGGNLSIPNRVLFAKKVFEWAAERPSDMGSPLDCYADGNSFVPFSHFRAADRDVFPLSEIGETSVIKTTSVQRILKIVETWVESFEPFILVGPEGCGKSMIINHTFKMRKNISIATLHCNAQTTADDVIQKIAQTCSLFSSSEGRVYRPRDSERLVLYLKDINLPKPDMYDTCQLIAFLQQLITFGGFYNESLEFLSIERIQIVASINAATTVGRHPLSSRFTAIVRIAVVDYPENAELVAVYDSFLNSVFNSVMLGDKKWLQASEREKLSNTIVEIYQKTKEKFTVDDQRHYLFTPRDITSLVKNICRYDLQSEDLLDVIIHESNRTFRDRLVDSDAASRFDQLVSSILRSEFRHVSKTEKSYFSSLVSARGVGKGDKDTVDSVSALLGNPIYRKSEEEIQKLIKQGLLYYEREEKELNLLLFPEMLENITHIDRTLSSYHGHLLLVGRAGVGRRHAVAIVSYMLGYELSTPSVGREYKTKEFCADVKAVLQTAGVKGEHCVLLLEDYQIISESILEITNSLISSGEVPGLYSHEELQGLLSPLSEIMREDGSMCRTTYEFFISRIKKYLHIVICMDPGNSKFLYFCEANPALYSHCTVLWLGEYKHSTLKLIPKLMTGVKDLLGCGQDEEVTRGESKGEEGKSSREESKGKEREDRTKKSSSQDESQSSDDLQEMILGIHTSCNAPPQEFQSFLSTWHSLYTSKEHETKGQLSNLTSGLNKLDSATEVVNNLRMNASQSKIDLAVAQAAADKAMEDITYALSNATERRVEVQSISKTVAAEREVTDAKKREIEDQLAEIQPILDSAKLQVGLIKSEHLNEIRSMTAPPEAIADVLAAVLMLLGVQDLSWLSMKKFLGNRGVKDDIMNFNAKTISNDLRKNVSKMIKKKADSFEAANITRVSVAAAPMAAWVKANIRYSLVIEKIEPLEADLQEEVYKLEMSQNRLTRCEEELRDLDDKVISLKKDFADRTGEAERLKRNLSLAGTTLDKAEDLISQLSGEQARWRSQVIQLQNDLLKLPMKMLLASGFVTYLSKAPEDIRSKLMAQWMGLTGVKSFSFKRVMSTESELLMWKSLGLPSDDLSQENGLVITSLQNRVPLIIDPASAAVDWLKNILSKNTTNPLEILSHHDKRFANQVELAVRFGKTLIIVEVDGVEPMLYSLCRRDLHHQGPRYVVTVGEKVVDYNEGFKLFLVTRNPEPDIPPDAASLVTVVNFTVTRSGLEGQLLGIAIQHEQPELEKAKGELLKREEDFKMQLADLERDLLSALATAEGDLLENTSLIESLTRTKEKAAQIEDALQKSAEASSQLDVQREVYRSFACNGSKIFFIVKSLQTLCHMYQFSLASFLLLYNQTLLEPMEAKHIEERLQRLCVDIEAKVLFFVGRALVKSDRAMFALYLCKGMHSDHFQPKEWEIFVGSLVVAVDDTSSLRNYPSWAPTDRQSAYKLLSEQLPHLISTLELDSVPKWQRFASSLEAEKDIPSIRGISLFQRVLLVQALRPDRLHSAILSFCCELMRIETISPPPLSLLALFEESSHSTPILLISSPGADASKELQEYAVKTVGADNYDELAMGGGQQEVALKLLRDAAVNGTWLCLKNLHLVAAWLPTLEKELSSLESSDNFRLWLTSESHSLFPSILLQQSLKVAYEAPPGIKKNLQRAFDSWDPDDFKQENPVRCRLMFLLACFHAVIQERRTYTPQGWSKFYEFSYGDMKAGTYVIEAITEGGKKNGDRLDWETIHGLMDDAIYGGRIDNLFDQAVLQAYLRMFFVDRLVGENSGGQEVIYGSPLRMPAAPTYESFKKTIALLSDADAPFVFNLPDNIERSLQRSSSQLIIRQLRLLSIVDVEASKYDREKWKLQLNPVLEVWAKLMTNTVMAKKDTVDRDSKRAALKPIDDFVEMESELANDICSIVASSLASLKKVLFGSGLLTPNIQTIAKALLADSIPAVWCKRWAGPEKPLQWLQELARKRNAVMRLKAITTKGNLLADALCLDDLFNPATFINALRQQTARQLNMALDRVTLICSWEGAGRKVSSCVLPCALAGLRLQGASFHKGILQENASDANELTLAPTVTIGFVVSGEQVDSRSPEVQIPLYLTPSREDLLLELPMPIDGDADKWILAGVALFMSDEA